MKATLKNGDVIELEKGITIADAAKQISMGLYRNATAAYVNGKVRDLRDTLEEDCELSILTFDDEDGKKAFWHTTSHVMAQAISRLFPNVKFAIGPAIDRGFYYDIDTDKQITAEDLEKIEAEMMKIVKENPEIRRFYLSPDEAIAKVSAEGEIYKEELIKEHASKGEKISFYEQGEFYDLCAGPHMMNMQNIKAVKLTSVAGAYWRGDEKNKMLTRIYGISFPKKSMLDEYLTRIEEAKKRDHRKLGKELGLFMITEEGPGFPFFLPNGMVLKNTLIDYWREIHRKNDYVEISTPIMLSRHLWETSGHWDHYKDNMY
ncbi:MAG: TGS domain-containing protein, partial [Acutalibacteraceae bacterium]|nr:TGS domain-containing protein [Acutalibacteraceae bacterium]